MKIDGVDGHFNQAKVDETRIREQRSAPVKSGGSDKAASDVQSAESVSLSGLAREVGKIKAAVREIPDIRREKVEAIKARIERGEYHVSGNEIAGKIIEDIIRQAR